jgi:hypothetical protein
MVNNHKAQESSISVGNTKGMGGEQKGAVVLPSHLIVITPLFYSPLEKRGE